MPLPLLLDLSHTSHTRARTGIQRVARALWRELGDTALAVTWDPFSRRWRALSPQEQANLRSPRPADQRGARWTLRAQWTGRLERLLRRAAPPAPEGSALFVPELFSPAVNRAFPALFRAVAGPRVAIFHDAIALKFPEYTPAGTVARFPGYLRDLLQFDGIAAISEDSRSVLLDYWTWLGVAAVPPVLALSPALERPPPPPAIAAPASGTLPIVLSVGSIEGRKNHLALLTAAESLWQAGHAFQLRLIGLAQTQTGGAALARIAELQRAGRPLRYEGPAREAELEAAYAAAAFTVYPSMMEGFGLPVAESLLRGKPCICSARGAPGETARGGGCLTLEEVDAPSLAGACERLLGEPATLRALTEAARRRTFPGWGDYVQRLREWMADLPVRPETPTAPA